MVDTPIEVWHGITRLVRGGAQGVVLDLIGGLDRERFQPVLIAGVETGSEGSLWPEAEALGIEIIRVPSLVRSVSPWRDWQTLRTLTRLLRQRRPAIVHAHTSKAGFLFCRAARRAGIARVLLSPHGHIAGAGAEIPGVPRKGMKRVLLASLARQSARDADLVICPNESERRDGIEHGMWSEAGSVVVPNGIDTDRFVPAARSEARRRLELDPAAPTIGVVARLTREKGVDLAITALSQLSGAPLANTQLVLVGDGPERESLHALASALGVADRVRFLGLQEDVAALYPAFDVLAVPSRTEAHGLVAAEALSCEIPVIAAEVGGLRSIIDPETCGAFFPPGDAAALATALARVLVDRPWAERLGRNGRRLVLERWSHRAMLLGTEQIYLEGLADLPAPRKGTATATS